MSETKKTSLAGCVAVLLTIPLLTLLRAFVTRDLWRWFVVPLGAPKIGLMESAGISLIFAYFTYQHNADPYKDEDNAWAIRLGVSLLSTIVPWGVGWLLVTVFA